MTRPAYVRPAVPRRTRRPLFRSLAARLVALGILQMVLVAGSAIAIFVFEGPHTAARPSDHLGREARQRIEALVDSPTELAVLLSELEAKRIDITLYDAHRQMLASNVEPPLAFPHRRGPWHADGRPPDAADDPPPPPDSPDALPDSRTLRPDKPDKPDAPDATPDSRTPRPDRPDRPDAPLDSRPDKPDKSDTAADGRPWAPHVMVSPLVVHGEHGFLIARGRPGAPPGLTGPLLALISGFFVLVIGALLTARWIVRPIEQLSKTARALGDGDLGARSRLGRSDEIGELGGRFDEMADRIASLLVSEKELLANVAHELRTPLTRIGVALDIAGEGDAEAARTSLAEIAVDVSELETIVDDVLTALRFEIASTKATELPLRRTPISPGEIARAAADRMRSRHAERPLELRVDSELSAIDVDPVLFRRVIDNLLENAHKYTPDAALPIVLAVSVGTDADGPRAIVFEVRDLGIGIPADDLPQIFTAFFRGERSRSRETGGVGLGLTLAKRIVEAHDGTIAATSAPGVGTTVRIAVPAHGARGPLK